MSGLKFDNTVSLGNVLMILFFIAGMVGIWVKIETTLAVNRVEIETLHNSVNNINRELLWVRYSLSRTYPEQFNPEERFEPPLNIPERD